MACAKAPPSIVERADDCKQFIQYIAEWCRDLDAADQRELDVVRVKFGLRDRRACSPQDVRNQLLQLLEDAVYRRRPVSAVTIKVPPAIEERVAAVGHQELVLDFNLSHRELTRAAFERQLNELLLTICAQRAGAPAGTVAQLNDTVSKQKKNLLDDLQGGKLVCCSSDLEKYFHQQYFAVAFSAYEDQIAWDGETDVQRLRESKLDWMLPWPKRRIYNMKAVFSLLKATSASAVNEYSFLPPVYARARDSQSGWQRTDFSPAGKPETDANAAFPSWIRNDATVGSDRGVNVCQFLRKGQEFALGQHMKACNIVYYLVIGNDVRRGCCCSPAAGAAGVCKRCNPSSVQIYIGKAANGVCRRWLIDQWAHCRAAKQLRDTEADCATFVKYAERNKSAKLVDVHLVLAYLRKWPKALFVVQECKDKDDMTSAEARLIAHHAATNMRHGLNCKQELVNGDLLGKVQRS